MSRAGDLQADIEVTGMWVYLVHHAEAIRSEVDPQRPLSAAGLERVARLAREAASRGVKPAVIRHSGKLRARQTAEPFRREANPLAEFTAAKGLQPDDPPGWIRDELEAESRDTMVVGHMPHIARLLSLLVRGRADADLDFPPHGLVAVERTGEGWQQRWRLS